MCRSSAKGLIVLARRTQSYQLCTLTPLSNPLLFESGVKTAWNSRKTSAAPEQRAAEKKTLIHTVDNNNQG